MRFRPAPTPSVWCVLVLLCVVGAARAADVGAVAEAATLRRPIAVRLSPDESRLYVANRRSGGVSTIAVPEAVVLDEVSVGRQLSDMRLLANGRWLALTDEAAHELVLVDAAREKLAVSARVPVAPYPVSVAITRDQKLAVVASLWSRRLTFVELPDDLTQARVIDSLDMPFAPRCQLFVKDDSRLIVADSFGGNLAILDPMRREILHLREFPAHNIRGLEVNDDGRMLVIAHQMLNELAHSDRNDVHWGLLMSNDLRWLKLDAVLSPDADLYDGAHMHPLGHAGSATGDPAGLIRTSTGAMVVTLGGVGEVAVGRERDFSLHRVEVGRRPTGLTANRDGGLVYVANTFDDTISVVDTQTKETRHVISLGPTPELSLADQGELLFFNAKLSHDAWMSCHSCHSDGHTNGLLNDNFSDATFGAPKRVLSLLGRADTAPFAWNGSADSLETQIRKSITVTMQSDDPPKDSQIAALAAYVTTLPAPPSVDQLRGVQDRDAVSRGGQLFADLQCSQCHQPPTYTSADTYDVGLVDKLGNRKFNPPSLRGVGQRGPFFHDGSAKTLEAVFRENRHQLETPVTDAQLDDLLTFLRSL